MRDTRILCPICHKRYKDRIGNHLSSVHNADFNAAKNIAFRAVVNLPNVLCLGN